MANHRQTKADEPWPLLTLNQLAGELGIPEATGRRLVARRVLLPDFTTGRISLFDPGRLPALKRLKRNIE